MHEAEQLSAELNQLLPEDVETISFVEVPVSALLLIRERLCNLVDNSGVSLDWGL